MSCGYVSGCAPSCTVPSCLPSCGSPCGYPVSGLGSLGSCGGPCSGGAVSASSLGMTSGANVACVNQIPSSEVMIQPPPCMITIPGAILAASCEPTRVGGYTACAGGSGLGSGRLSGPLCGYPC